MDIRKKQRAVVEALEDVKGRDITVFNTERMPSMFERVIIASADSNRQVKALADRVTGRIKSLGAKVEGVEGEANAEWVLVDLGEIVVHVMHHTIRSHYNLEELWGGKTVRMKPSAETPVRVTASRETPARVKPSGPHGGGMKSAKKSALKKPRNKTAVKKPGAKARARKAPAAKPTRKARP